MSEWCCKLYDWSLYYIGILLTISRLVVSVIINHINADQARQRPHPVGHGFNFQSLPVIKYIIFIVVIFFQKHGLKVHIRQNHSFTPLLEEPGPTGRPRYLLLGRDEQETYHQIAKFSKRDAEVKTI